jgi:hypothetical protein
LRSAKRNPGQINRNPDQERHEKSGNNAAAHHPKAEAPMKVEIIEHKPTTIVGFGIPDVQLGVAIALSAVIVGIVACVVSLIRASEENYIVCLGVSIQSGIRNTANCESLRTISITSIG